MAILQAAVPHNDPVNIAASLANVGPSALMSAYYSNLENAAENRWLERDVVSINKFLVFDEKGFHRLRFGAGDIGATAVSTLGVVLTNSGGAVQLYDAASGTPVAGSVPFTGPAVELEVRIYSF